MYYIIYFFNKPPHPKQNPEYAPVIKFKLACLLGSPGAHTKSVSDREHRRVCVSSCTCPQMWYVCVLARARIICVCDAVHASGATACRTYSWLCVCVRVCLCARIGSHYWPTKYKLLVTYIYTHIHTLISLAVRLVCECVSEFMLDGVRVLCRHVCDVLYTHSTYSSSSRQ